MLNSGFSLVLKDGLLLLSGQEETKGIVSGSAVLPGIVAEASGNAAIGAVPC